MRSSTARKINLIETIGYQATSDFDHCGLYFFADEGNDHLHSDLRLSPRTLGKCWYHIGPPHLYQLALDRGVELRGGRCFFSVIKAHLSDVKFPAVGIHELAHGVAKKAFDRIQHRDKRWFSHGANFIRAAVHLKHRARCLGYHAIADEIVFAGEHYGLSHPFVYENSLREECEATPIWTPLTDVFLDPPPTSFVETFGRDVATKSLEDLRKCS